jgi:hypothetical protein
MITASTFALGHAQIDGRHYVTETHERDNGDPLVIEYLASIDTDYQAVMEVRAQQMNDDEQAAIDAPVTLDQIKEQLVAEYRQALDDTLIDADPEAVSVDDARSMVVGAMAVKVEQVKEMQPIGTIKVGG